MIGIEISTPGMLMNSYLGVRLGMIVSSSVPSMVESTSSNKSPDISEPSGEKDLDNSSSFSRTPVCLSQNYSRSASSDG